ncbi:hypothetical protein AX17_005179 [Amanita inopinata Kibby_2008]|nr:hypothetical protein AX17_005179 [Amanita inopinata Kibby_2008]
MSTTDLSRPSLPLPINDKITPSYPTPSPEALKSPPPDHKPTASPAPRSSSPHKQPSPPPAERRSPSPKPSAVGGDDIKQEKQERSERQEEEQQQQEDQDDDIIDMETFQQLLELDEDENDREFSKEMVYAYFEQAAQTFDKMDEALKEKDLSELSSLGHFLKGSSAALGVAKVQESCEQIQHYGQLQDEKGAELPREEALEKIEALLGQVKAEYSVAVKWLKKQYE